MSFGLTLKLTGRDDFARTSRFTIITPCGRTLFGRTSTEQKLKADPNACRIDGSRRSEMWFARGNRHEHTDRRPELRHRTATQNTTCQALSDNFDQNSAQAKLQF
jgi:hypothetical protein